MPTPINPNLSTSKTDYASRPGIPASQKESATEWNLLVSAVKANYERLILDWTTDILANVTLSVGQYVLYDDGVAIAVYKIITAYNVGSPITWNPANAEIIIESSPNRFKGVYASEAALEAAHPTAEPGDYALVDVGAAEAQLWIWDDTDSEWIASGVTTVVPPWDDTTQGIVERSTTAEMQAVADGVAAGSSAGLSGSRTGSEIGLFDLLSRFLTKALTWTAQQIFSVAPRFSSTTASQFLKVDSNKDLVSTAAATQAEMITGTDNDKPATAKSVEDKGSVKLRSVSNSATGTNNIDCQNQDTVHVVFGTVLTGANEITVSNAGNLQLLNVTVQITGSNINITTPSSTRMARYHEVASGPGWYQSTKILMVSAIGTADFFELSFKRSLTDASVFTLTYDGPTRA